MVMSSSIDFNSVYRIGSGSGSIEGSRGAVMEFKNTSNGSGLWGILTDHRYVLSFMVLIHVRKILVKACDMRRF